MMTDTNDGVDTMMDEMMGGAYPALPGDEMVRSTTTTVNSTTVTCDLHHSGHEEEKEEETAITNYDNRDAINNVDMMDEMMGGAYPAPGDEMVSSTFIVSVPRNSTELAQNGNNSSNTNPNEPLVPPAGLTSKARRNGVRNIGPSQRPGAYTARGRAF
jgi:hypothetical protein